MSTKYKLIGYKPSGADYCMGCLMDSWDSDTYESGPLSEDKLVEEIARLKIENDSWELDYMLYPNDIEYEKCLEIDSKVDDLIKKMLNDRAIRKEAERRWAQKKLNNEKIEKDIALLKQLKEKYQNE